MLLLGIGSVLLGGLLAAITGPLRIEAGSWLAAYLVLVAGVPQVAFAVVPSRVETSRLAWIQVACWNVGNVLVIVATLVGFPWGVDLGGIVLCGGLWLAWRAVWHRDRTGFALVAYRGVLLVLLVSIPVGALLAHIRA